MNKLIFLRICKRPFFILSSSIILFLSIVYCFVSSFIKDENIKEILKNLGFLVFLFPCILQFFVFSSQFLLDSINDKKNNFFYLIRSSKNNYFNFVFWNVLYYYIFSVGFSLIPLIYGLSIYSDINNFYYIIIYFLFFNFISTFENYCFIYLFNKFIRLKLILYLFYSFYSVLVISVLFYSFIIYLSPFLDQSIYKGTFIFFINPTFYLYSFIINNFSQIQNIGISIGSILSFIIVSIFVIFLIKNDKNAVKYKNNANFLINLKVKSFSYIKKIPIFNSFEFSIIENQRIGILGRNGTGKSTLIKLISGYLKSNNTELLFSKANFNLCGAYQEFHFDQNFTCFQIFKNFSLIYKNNFSNDRLKEIFEDFGIASFANEKYNNLSFGTKQKIKLIFAVINNPKVLILDEPFSGLDEPWTNFYKSFLKQYIQDKKISLVLISHSSKDQKEFSDIYYKIDKKSLVRIDNLQETNFL